MIPIVITVYNRLDTLRKTLDSLFECDGIEGRTILFFADNNGKQHDAKIQDVWHYIQTELVNNHRDTWQFYPVHGNNLGLRANSLRAINVSLKKYHKIIFIQDDMQFSKSFLSWMDYALEKYEDRKDIMFISGYSHIDYPSSYLSPLIADGLGIWRNKYEDPAYLIKVNHNYKEFAKHTTDSFANNLKNIIDGKSDAFMALLCYQMYLVNARCLYPGLNKVRYMVSNSTNCKAKESKKLNNILYNEFDLDESDTAYNLIKQTKNFKWSKLKKCTRWLRNLIKVLFQTFKKG